MRLLLHACCGPCLIEPLDALSDGNDVAVAYANPNIHPAAEYRERRDALLAYAVDRGVPVTEAEYEPARWEKAVAGLPDDKAARCAACYRLRLGVVAGMAAETGHEAIATTMTVSPFQDPDAIHAAGEAAASEAGVIYVHTDFRKAYASAVARSKALGMYRQRYCGCRLSEKEAEDARSRKVRG